MVAASNGGRLALRSAAIGFALFRDHSGCRCREQRDGLGDHAPVLQPRQVAAIEVIAAADHDFDAAHRRGRQSEPRVGQGSGGGFQDQELLGLTAGDGARHDAVRGGIEGERGIEIAAATDWNAIAGRRLRVAKRCGVPAIGGNFARAVLARENILEERARVGRTGEAAAEADQGDFGGASPAHEPISSGSAARWCVIGSSRVPSLPERMTSTSPFCP